MFNYYLVENGNMLYIYVVNYKEGFFIRYKCTDFLKNISVGSAVVA